MPARDMWLGDLSSALGPAAFGVGQGCVLVRLIDDLAMPPFEECNVRKQLEPLYRYSPVHKQGRPNVAAARQRKLLGGLLLASILLVPLAPPHNYFLTPRLQGGRHPGRGGPCQGHPSWLQRHLRRLGQRGAGGGCRGGGAVMHPLLRPCWQLGIRPWTRRSGRAGRSGQI